MLASWPVTGWKIRTWQQRRDIGPIGWGGFGALRVPGTASTLTKERRRPYGSASTKPASFGRSNLKLERQRDRISSTLGKGTLPKSRQYSKKAATGTKCAWLGGNVKEQQNAWRLGIHGSNFTMSRTGRLPKIPEATCKQIHLKPNLSILELLSLCRVHINVPHYRGRNFHFWAIFSEFCDFWNGFEQTLCYTLQGPNFEPNKGLVTRYCSNCSKWCSIPNSRLF
jgi:hypothetical protein